MDSDNASRVYEQLAEQEAARHQQKKHRRETVLEDVSIIVVLMAVGAAYALWRLLPPIVRWARDGD